MDYLDIYKKILLIRTFEHKLDELFKKGLIHGTAHLCIGQEYIPAIISQHISIEDCVTSTHRGHGHALSKGLDQKKFLAELMGKSAGYCSGKGGTQHTISTEHNFYTNGITGGMVPVGTGIAFSNKYKKNNKIVVTYIGDGGFNEGYVMEALNLAQVSKLPILFVCENNLYAMGTHIKFSHSSSIIEKVKGFGIKSEIVDDNDYVKLDKVSKKFIEEIRELSEPRFIVVNTYRHSGHSKNDLNLYRDKNEEKKWFDLDVLTIIKKELIKSKKLTEKKLDQIEKEYQEQIDKTSKEVILMPEPDPTNVLKELYRND